jgi:transcriptional regulator with GAF, ATPase, and Fis domain
VSLDTHTRLALWREVARHGALEPTLESLQRILAAAPKGVRSLALFALDLGRQSLVLLGRKGATLAGLEEVPLGAGFAPLSAWAARGKFARAREVALPDALAAHDAWWVGGLVSDEGPLGLALLEASRRTPPDAGLLEPLATVVVNHRRQRELESLKRVAEADRDAALARLGRARLEDVIIGAEGGMRHVMERVDLVARAAVSVLLLGETGSGKEVVARAIHQRSPRHSGPFHRVNCGAVPAELIDSELFGHERGGFTGAIATRKGWFERADGGTLFLDEIGELSPAAQVRLLRVLQDGVIERVGGHDPVRVDVRIVAATHRDLRRMVREGRFREDLWYRIATFPIEIPPLRDRPEDIAPLARHFAERAANRFGLPVRMPTQDDLRLLAGYDWPGNVRELAAVIDRACILGRGDALAVATALGGAAGGHGMAPVVAARDAATLDAAARELIERTLAACRGRIEGPRGAAARLAINPHTLRARMRKLGIDWARFRD